MVSAPSPRRRPAVHAGRFYPSNPTRLRADVQGYLAQAGRWEAAAPGAVIAPHAGYFYSVVVAASAFAASPLRRRSPAARRRSLPVATGRCGAGW